MSSKVEKEIEFSVARDTVKFNVGGKLYEISKSLLEQFPATMLAKTASSSSSSPLFIDRDPDRFAFCLDYMRDNGEVHLPETVSKLAFLKELEFFGFVNIDETKIRDEKSKQNCMAGFHEIAKETKERIARMETDLEQSRQEIEMEKVALRCLEESLKCNKHQIIVNYYPLSNLPNLHNRQYFIECCDKLALRAVSGGNTNAVKLTRKTRSQGQK